MKKTIQTILLIVAMFAVLLGGAYLLSKAAWIDRMGWPSVWLHGAWLVLEGVYLFSKAKRFSGTKFERIGKPVGMVAWLCLGAGLMLDIAAEFAGV